MEGKVKQAKFMVLGKARPGTCEVCAVAHEPEQPHNRDSLFYQYKFYEKNGRWPTWADAMEHCTPEIRALWREELEKRGIKVDVGEANG